MGGGGAGKEVKEEKRGGKGNLKKGGGKGKKNE